MGLHPGETVDSSRFFMNSTEIRNFQDLFKEDSYIVLKNYLYNYLLRKRAVKKSLFVPFFRWANLFYKGFVWLDAKIMPLSLSSVILIKSNVLKEVNTVNAKD